MAKTYTYPKDHKYTCPQCGGTVMKDKYKYTYDMTIGRLCPECGKRNTCFKNGSSGFHGPHSDESKRKISTSHTGKVLSSTHKQHISDALLADPRLSCWKWKKMPEVVRKKMSNAHKGKVFSEEHKRKLRESAIRNMDIRQGARSFNHQCCDYLDVINGIYEDEGVHFRHATNHPDGEFRFRGYYADGYDEKNNIWFEWDEPYHDLPYQKEKDIKRQTEIIKYLGCRVWRYDEKHKQQYWINN